MKLFLLVFALLVYSAESGDGSPDLTHRFIVLPTSTLQITGKTNVNSFTCSTTYCGKDSLVLREGGGKSVFEKGLVTLDATAFSCGMQLMTNDFNKTIKSKEYPSINIEFLSFERVPVYGCKEEQLKGSMKISLGGVTKTFPVTCTLEATSQGLVHLKGGRDFTFSDFKLETPSRMLGMVKVHDTLTVTFHLILKLDPNA